MEFVDHYATLNVMRNATNKEIKKAYLALTQNKDDLDDEQRQQIQEAYKILGNRYKRARYHRTLGYVMVAQIDPAPYPNAVVHQLNTTQPYYTLQKITALFKTWLWKKFELDWKEAQKNGYACALKENTKNPYLVLHFPYERDVEHFTEELQRHQLITANVSPNTNG